MSAKAQVVLDMDETGTITGYKINGHMPPGKIKWAEGVEPPVGLAFIYVLVENRRENKLLEMFYVGKTGGSLASRMAAHKSAATGDNKKLVYKYIRQMNSEGRQFGVRVLEVCLSSNVRERERYWMNGLAARGEPIQNEDGIVLPETGEFAELALMIRTHPELKMAAKATLSHFMFDPFDCLRGSMRLLLERGS